VTAIVCIDHEFYQHLDTLCPAFPGLRERFASNPASTEGSMIRNGNLQGGYLIMALRSLGLNVGPMSGFDNAAVDVAFLEGSSWKSNFLLNIGYSDADKNYPRAPRLSFEVASQFA
jgi:nitroreductase